MEEKSEGRGIVTRDRVITVLGVVCSIAGAFGGIFMMGQAWEYPDHAALIFGGGVLLNALGLGIALHIPTLFD